MKRSRIYIGQSNTLNTRIKQHWSFRYRRDNPSLHYYAMQQSIFDSFTVLATLPSPGSKGYKSLPGMDQPELVLNVLEMWCCLLFRTLPRQTLEAWLPEHLCKANKLYRGAVEGSGLNIAPPLDHGDRSSRSWVDLSISADPLILDFVKSCQNPAVGLKSEGVVEEKGEDAIKVKNEEELGVTIDESIIIDEEKPIEKKPEDDVDSSIVEDLQTATFENDGQIEDETPDLSEDVPSKVSEKRGLPRIEFQVSINPLHAIGVVVLGLVAMRFIRARR